MSTDALTLNSTLEVHDHIIACAACVSLVEYIDHAQPTPLLCSGPGLLSALVPITNQPRCGVGDCGGCYLRIGLIGVASGVIALPVTVLVTNGASAARG